MKYVITDTAIIQLSETAGTLQNVSGVNSVEISDSADFVNCLVVYPLDKITFDKALYVRAYGKLEYAAELNVMPSTDGGGTVTPEPVELLNPNLQVMYNSKAVGDSMIMYGHGSGAPTYFDVTYSGNGVVTVSDTGDYFYYDSTTKKIELDDHNSFLNNEGNTTTITVNLASDGTYDTATKVFTVISMGDYVPTPDLPTVEL